VRRSPLLPIFLIVLVDVLGLTIVIPLLAIYSEKFGASPFVATMIMSTFAICQLVSGPILGKLSDRHGRRPILLISQLGTLAGFVMMAKASALWMVFAGRILDGSTAGNLAIAQAYISDHTAPEKRAKSFALIGIAFGLGFAIGPVISGWLSHYSLAMPFWAAASLSGCSILGTIFILPKDAPTAPALPGAQVVGPGGARLGILDWGMYGVYFRRPALGRLLVQFFVYMFSFSLFIGCFALYAERHFVWHGHYFRPREIGFAFAGSSVVSLVIQGGLIGRLVRRFGEANLSGFGFLTLFIGYLVLGSSEFFPLDRRLYVLAVSIFFSSIGNSLLRPVLTSLVTREADRTEQGVVLGLTQSLSSVAAVVAPPVAGALISHHLGLVWAWLGAAVGLVGFFLVRRADAPRN
jgi:DHA1 family tetracycline resistance protein-like MFS transporter